MAEYTKEQFDAMVAQDVDNRIGDKVIDAFKRGAKKERERIKAELLKVFLEHYWDSVSKDKEIIMLHCKKIIEEVCNG